MKRIFYIAFVPCLIGILAISILHPQNNLVPARIFLYTLVWIMILTGIRVVLGIIETWLRKGKRNLARLSHTGLIFYVILYGVALYGVSVLLRSNPITDYESVYRTAYTLASGEPVANWDYFSMWTNNLNVLTILTCLMKIPLLAGVSDPYYFLLAMNVLQMMAVLTSLYYLAGKIGEKRYSVQWFTVILFTLWTPVWSSTNAFYSDQMSFGGGVIALAIYFYTSEKLQIQGFSKWFCLFGSGLLWGISASAKITAATAFVALLILHILSGKKGFTKEYLFFALIFVMTLKGFSLLAEQYPSRENEDWLKMPVEYWIAMGLEGNGTYADNTYLVEGCFYSPNAAERKSFCRDLIRERYKNLFDRDHVIRKTSVIFGSGDISPTSLIYPVEENFLWHLFYWEGDYYWKYTCTSTSFFYAVLLLILAGSVMQTIRYQPDDLMFLVYLTIFGLFVFLMMWEAQNKQLYNHIPWLTLAAVYGIDKMTIKKESGM